MTTEHDLARSRSAPRAPAPDDDLAPGRGSRSSQLAAPAHPLVGGLLQRKARDANGVADDADAAVAHAASSTGALLPEPIMRKLESSLGTDLSSVRVHTDGESASAAHAVGARAYTVGQDIHFGAGQYDPSTAGGQHLIAHEVAHTMQQAGSSGGAQYKLEVSQSGDPLEAEADAFAETFIGGGVAPVSLSRSAAKVARDPITLDPVIISNDPKQQKDLEAQRDAMLARFPEVARGFCRDWFSAATAALGATPDPGDPFVARNFFCALAGNLLWATTSVTAFYSGIGGGAALAVVAASVGGAAGASGAAATPAPPSGRGVVASMLAKDRDQLEKSTTAHEFLVETAAECISDPTAAHDKIAQDRKLWEKFARGIPFEARTSVMFTQIAGTLAKWLSAYQAQWLAWKARADVTSKANEYRFAESASEPFSNPFTTLTSALDIGTPEERHYEMATQDIPFIQVFPGAVAP